MKKPVNPAKSNELFPELITQRKNLNTTSSNCKLRATRNPRKLRVLRAFLANPYGISREALDRIAGCSNGPELVADLRRDGLGTRVDRSELQCNRVPTLDRDGRVTRPGRYTLTPCGRRAVLRMFARTGKGLK